MAVEFRNISILETDFRKSAKPWNIFGLGESYYSPSSGTAVVTILGDKQAELTNILTDFDMEPVNLSYYLHESAHSLLTSVTSAGRILLNVIAFRYAVAFLILKKQLQGTEDEKNNPELKKLRALLKKLLSVEEKLFDGWKESQEIFAFLFTFWIRSALISFTEAMFDLKFSDFFRLMHLLKDEAVIERIFECVQAYCTERGIDWRDMNQEEMSELVKSADTVFRNDPDLKRIFLDLFDSIRVPSDQKNEGDILGVKYYKFLKEELEEDFKRGEKEHLSALKIIKLHKQDEVGLLTGAHIAASMLFLPKVNPDDFVRDNEIRFGSVSALAEKIHELIYRIFAHEIAESDYRSIIDKIYSHRKKSKRFFAGLNEAMKETNCVLISEKVKETNILASPAWVKAVTRHYVKGRWNRKLVLNIYNSLRLEGMAEEKIAFERIIDSVKWIPERILIGWLFVSAKFMVKFFPRRFIKIRNVIDTLKMLKLDSVKKVIAFLRKYREQFAALKRLGERIDEGEQSSYVSNPSVIRDKKELKIVLPMSPAEYIHHYLRLHCFCEIMDTVLDNSKSISMVCPYGAVIAEAENLKKQDEFCCKSPLKLFDGCDNAGECRLKRFLKRSELSGMLICANSSREALFIRYFKSEEPEVVHKVPCKIVFSRRDNLQSEKEGVKNASEEYESLALFKLKILTGGKKTEKDETEKTPIKHGDRKERSLSIRSVLKSAAELNRKEFKRSLKRPAFLPFFFLEIIVADMLILLTILFISVLNALISAVFFIFIDFPLFIRDLISSIKEKKERKRFRKSYQFMINEFNSLFN